MFEGLFIYDIGKVSLRWVPLDSIASYSLGSFFFLSGRHSKDKVFSLLLLFF